MTAVEVVADADGTLLVRKRASTPTERRRLHREAVALARAAHPGVVPLVEPAGRSGGAHTDAVVAPVDERSELLTRFVGGHTLETTGPASTARARIERLTILAAVADILGDLHAQGLVHGALDPSHIVLDQGNRPVLCGFSRSGEVGTLPWPLPPPDLEPSNVPLRPSQDVAELGSMLLEALGTARRWTPRAGLRADERLRALGQAASAEDPTGRPSARAVASGIRAALDPVRTQPAGSRIRIGAPTRVGVPLVVLLVVVAGSVGANRLLTAPGRGTAPPHTAALGDLPSPVPAPPNTFVEAAVERPDAGPDGPTAAPRTPTSSTGADGPEGRPCDAALVPLVPPFPAPPCTASALIPEDGIDTGGQRFRVGSVGDEVVITDWRCTGRITVVLLRPSSGAVHGFDSWATTDHVVPAEPIGLVPPGSHLETGPATAGGCLDLFARAPDGSSHLLPRSTP